MNKLSEIMWVETGYGNSRQVFPFRKKENILENVLDDRLFQIDETKSMFDNIYEICQQEYRFPTVVMTPGSEEIPTLNVTNAARPTILGLKLPTLLMIKHNKEYSETADMTLTDKEVKALSKYLTKARKAELDKLSDMQR